MAKYSLVPADVPPVATRWRTIRTPLPVPESLPILEALEAAEPVSMAGQPPVVWERAEGCRVFDPYGNAWLDWSSGVLITNIGHGHPAVIAAVREVLERPLLASYVFPHRLRAELCELLVRNSPPPLAKVFLLSTGSEAVENAIKLAFTWGRDRGKNVLVSFENAFHGRTLGVQLAGGMPRLKAWIPRPDPSFVQVPFPDGYKNPDTRFALFDETLAAKAIDGGRVCAVLSETYQGVGPDFMPEEYARALRAWCDRRGALLILDEVQAGFGRTGKFYGFEHYGIAPDLVCLGKGITSSLPLAAVIGRADVMDQYAPGSMTSTHSASPLPVAAAIASIKALLAEDLIGHAARMEPVLRDGLAAIVARRPDVLGCLQVRGMVAGIQVVKPGTREPDGATALAINTACFRKGLLMFAPVGVGGECLKICPPLSTPEDALREGIAALGEAVAETL
ncbi:MAG TPA: aspartate aminotransferase family protein [Planctomycetes bacterium]|nr:aspartate aminotransferase family protein [Planctomycetota bacterium]